MRVLNILYLLIAINEETKSVLSANISVKVIKYKTNEIPSTFLKSLMEMPLIINSSPLFMAVSWLVFHIVVQDEIRQQVIFFV